MRAPAATPAAAPARTEPVVFDTSAKTKPDIAMFEAKDKSISPVTTTSVIAVATIMMNGIVERKVMYMLPERNAPGAQTAKKAHSANSTAVIISWFLLFFAKSEKFISPPP